MRRRYDPDVDESAAYKDARARREKEEADLIDEAHRDILKGDFESFAVLECRRVARTKAS